jgi:hypothetical protein
MLTYGAGNEGLTLEEIEAAIASHNDWSQVVKNSKEETLAKLSPAAVSGSLTVPIFFFASAFLQLLQRMLLQLLFSEKKSLSAYCLF